MMSRRHGEDYADLVVKKDGSVQLKIDLPPPCAIHDSPELWDEAARRQYLKWEVRRLEARLPPGVESVKWTNGPSTSSTSPPPWRVEAVINGPEGSAYRSSEGIRVLMLLSENYPSVPPDVNILQTVHHFFLDHDNGLPHIYYELLTDIAESASSESPRFSLRDALRLLYHVLQSPLHPCAGCQEQFDVYARMNRERLETIEQYGVQCCHAELFDRDAGWRAEWLHPTLRAAIESGTDEALRKVVEEVTEGVYRFPMLTHACCEMIIDEVDTYTASGLPTSRPNSMNKYGLVLNEIGMEPMFNSLQERVLRHIARLLFGDEGAQLDRHHSFVVQYAAGKDLGLDMHTDNSDVTFNVCLGRQFEGAGLTFCGYMGQAKHRKLTHCYRHVKGDCVVHLGRRRHGADDITSGERLNLIIWNHNLVFRNSKAYLELQQQKRYEREAGPPDIECLSYTHDRDYLQYKEKPAAHAKMTRRPWCPPKFAAHDAGQSPSSEDLQTEDDGGAGSELGAVEDDESTLEDAKVIQEVLASVLSEAEATSR